MSLRQFLLTAALCVSLSCASAPKRPETACLISLVHYTAGDATLATELRVYPDRSAVLSIGDSERWLRLSQPDMAVLLAAIESAKPSLGSQYLAAHQRQRLCCDTELLAVSLGCSAEQHWFLLPATAPICELVGFYNLVGNHYSGHFFPTASHFPGA